MATYEAFSQVLLWVWNDDRFTGNRALEDMVRTGDPNKPPSLALKAADDVPAVGKHVVVLSCQSRASLGHQIIRQAISMTASERINFQS
jgi:hypothetical protein